MKHIKKIGLFTLSLIIVISALAACSGGSNQNSSSSQTKAEEQAEQGTTGPAKEKSSTVDEKTTGGLTGQINVYTRDAASGTRDGFESVVGFKDQLTDTANEVASNGEMSTQVGKDPQAIGYASLTTDFAANNIKGLFYEGIEPTEANVLSGDYELSRPFDYVTRASGDYVNSEEEQLVKAFVDFLTKSTEGLEAVASEGGIVNLDGSKPWEELAKDHPICQQDNSAIVLKTCGSTSVEKTIRAALEAFVPYAGGFKFEMDQTGSGDGWKRVLGPEKDGPTAAHIGFASRNFKQEEDTSKALASGTYCLDAIVTIVEAKNPLTGLSQQQVFDIFTGAAKNWDDILE